MSIGAQKVVVIGCGDWGKNIARTLHGLGSLHGICDHHSSEKAVQCTKDLKVPLMDLETVLEDSAVDGVVISTQTASHYSLAKRALEAGKHVFVEKPLVPTLKEAEELESIAQEKGLVLMVGHLLRYHQAFETLAQWVQEEKLGRVLHVNSSRKNLGKIYPNESVIWDLAPHDLSMVLAIFQRQPKSVLASSGNYAVPLHGDEAVLALDFDHGQKAFITLSRLSPFKEQKITVVGTAGMAVFDDTLPWENKVTFFESTIEQTSLEKFEVNRDGEGTSEKLSASEPLNNEMQHFVGCINGNEKPRTPAREAIDVLKIIQAAHLSVKEGCWVDL